MRFRRKVLGEIRDRLAQVGLTKCPICDSEEIVFDHRPVLLEVGGRNEIDPDRNVLWMVRCLCRLCGYTMLFDSEQYHHGDEPILFQGSPEELDAEP